MTFISCVGQSLAIGDHEIDITDGRWWDIPEVKPSEAQHVVAERFIHPPSWVMEAVASGTPWWLKPTNEAAPRFTVSVKNDAPDTFDKLRAMVAGRLDGVDVEKL